MYEQRRLMGTSSTNRRSQGKYIIECKNHYQAIMMLVVQWKIFSIFINIKLC